MAEACPLFASSILAQGNNKSYSIEHKATAQASGIVSLTAINYRNRSTECIIEIGVKEMRGKGVGTAALSLLLDFAFNELNLHRVSLKVLSFNERAIRLYEKIGFFAKAQCGMISF